MKTAREQKLNNTIEELKQIPAGSWIRFWLQEDWTEDYPTLVPDSAVFVSCTGEGENARVTLNQGFDWEVYRYNGEWAYGSSAEKIVFAAATIVVE